MASGTSWNGSHSPGTNLTSNAHEHVINVNKEPIKQDLPKKETQKVNPISSTTSTFNPLRLSLPSMARGAAKLNPSSLLACMPSLRRISSSPLPISAAKSARPIVSPQPLSNNQNSPVPLHDLRGGVLITNNQELPDSVRIYFTVSDRLLDIFPGLKASVKAMSEGGTLTSCRDTLAASMASLEQVVNRVGGVYLDQLHMQKKQQSDCDSLDAKLRAIDFCKDIYNAIFTLFASLCGAGVVIAAKVYPVRVAMAVGGVAAAASVLFLAVGKRMDSYQDERKIPVQKRKDIAEAINGASKLAVGHMDGIKALASYLKSHTESILKMVDSNVIVTEIEALKRGFQELETKVERCSTDANSGRQAVVQTITNNLDKSSWFCRDDLAIGASSSGEPIQELKQHVQVDAADFFNKVK